MRISRMNHAMLSFALLGGMLVGARPYAERPWPPEPQTPRAKLAKPPGPADEASARPETAQPGRRS